MKIYRLVKKENGETKELADVIEFDNNKVVVSWLGNISSIVVHENINNFKQISVNHSPNLILMPCICTSGIIQIIKKTDMPIPITDTFKKKCDCNEE